MFIKNAVLIALIGSATARFEWTNPNSYLPGAFHFVTGSKYTFDTQFKSQIFEALLNSGEKVGESVSQHYRTQMRDLIIADIRRGIEDDATNHVREVL